MKNVSFTVVNDDADRAIEVAVVDNYDIAEKIKGELIEINTPPKGYRWCGCEYDNCGCICGYDVDIKEVNNNYMIIVSKSFNY